MPPEFAVRAVVSHPVGTIGVILEVYHNGWKMISKGRMYTVMYSDEWDVLCM